MQLSGRLGRDPTFRTTTKTGTLVGRFPLTEHLDDGQTCWHTVLAFGDRAKLLQRRTQAGELAQGRQVDVVGYLHTNTRPGKDGRPRTVQEVYATAVTRHCPGFPRRQGAAWRERVENHTVLIILYP